MEMWWHTSKFQLSTKQQEITTLKSQLAESNDRTTKFEREVTALKTQINSIDTQKNSSLGSTLESKEITSLKIDLEKLKAECQQRQNQQNKTNRELADSLKLIVAQEIAKLQLAIPPEIEIDAEIVIQESEVKPQNSTAKIADEPIASNLSPFAKAYNSGTADFLRAYMVSTAGFVGKNGLEIELIEDNIGSYWIVPLQNNNCYLVPKIDIHSNRKYFEGLTLLFDGKNDDINFTLFKPAIVTITKANMPKRWKLAQKGYLEPKLSI